MSKEVANLKAALKKCQEQRNEWLRKEAKTWSDNKEDAEFGIRECDIALSEILKGTMTYREIESNPGAIDE